MKPEKLQLPPMTISMIVVLILLIISYLLFSCNTPTNSTGTETTKVNSGKENSDFDWSKSKTLKQKMLNDLSLKNRSNDEIVVSFLKEYVKLEAEINEILFARPDYETLNSLFNTQNGKTDSIVIKLTKEVEDGGFKIAITEGMIYIAQSSGFIKSGTIDLIDSVSNEFLNLYCDEIDTVCCEDAGLAISVETLVGRITKLGEIMEKVKGLRYMEIVESEFYANLQLLYLGLDNTPSFDQETGKFDIELLDWMKEIIKNQPNSKAANEFKEFIKVLETEKYRNTDNIYEFMNRKFDLAP